MPCTCGEQLLCLTKQKSLTLVDLNMTWWSLPDPTGTEEEYLMRHGITDQHDLAKHMELFNLEKNQFHVQFQWCFPRLDHNGVRWHRRPTRFTS